MILASLSPRNSTFEDIDIESRRGLLVILGPILIGALFNWLLLGSLTMQAYVYHLCFPKDYWWIKLSAYGLYLLEIGQTVLVTQIAWAFLCAGWGIPSSLLQMDWGFSMTPPASGLIACWVQIFFAWRVWALGHNMFWKSVATAISVVSFCQGSAAIHLGIRLSTVDYFYGRAEVLHEIHYMFLFYLIGSAVADFLIAISLLYFLITTRRTSWSKETNRRVTKLIRTTSETGVLCSVVAFLDLIIYLYVGRNSVHISIVMVLSKLYSNALMASLNSRAGVNERPTMSDSHEEAHTTRFNASQFTSVGIPATTTDEFEWVNGSDGQGFESEYAKTGFEHTTIILTNLGRV